LESSDFARFCHNHGISMSHIEIVRLWQLGLLHADQVRSTRRIRKAGLAEIGTTSRGEYAYADARPHRTFSSGLAAAATRLKELPSYMRLYFHPFRFCVICQYQKSCQLYPPPTDLTPLSGIQKLQKHYSSLQMHSGTTDHLRTFFKANGIASLAIAAEPCVYPLIFRSRRFRTLDQTTHLQHVRDHWTQIEEIYKKIGERSLKEVWELLGWYSASLEPNSGLHEKLRLASSEVREEKLRGPLAGAVYLKTIAEVIRRAAERALQTEWPEEGETWSYTAAYKQHLYGARRIFDGDPRISSRVLRMWWPSVGLHVRWYVEGETELGALEHHFGQNPAGIDLVPFRGTASGWLADQLRNDFKNGTYSFVSFDRSVKDKQNYKWFRKRVEEGKFFGVWYVSEPDFEFANFSLEELQEILWQMATENKARSERRPDFLKLTMNCRNGKELERCTSKFVELKRFSKGKDWGRRLMQFAETHPLREGKEDRQIISALRDGCRGAAGWFNHWLDRSMFQIDPETGRFVEKK